MTPIEFDADLRREGYQVMNTSLAPNQLNLDHTHEFDARIMVLAGEITITRDGQAKMYRPGDYWMTPAHTVHAELAGPEGVAIIMSDKARGDGGSSLKLAVLSRSKTNATNGELPGGRLEPGEAPETCLAREFAEELGTVVEVAPSSTAGCTRFCLNARSLSPPTA
jgi:quercetin dioxygenase-like cupin family protein